MEVEQKGREKGICLRDEIFFCQMYPKLSFEGCFFMDKSLWDTFSRTLANFDLLKTTYEDAYICLILF